MGDEWTIIRNQENANRGSIWLGWNKRKWAGSILHTHDQFIHARLKNVGGYEFEIMVVYGENNAVKRRRLWEGITASQPTSDSNDWLLIGDFNEIRHPAERDGHGSFDIAGADEFESAIVGFTELEAIGEIFTWSNGIGPLHTSSRLDRALGNPRWIARWPQSRPRLLMGTSSDHAGLQLQLTHLEKRSTPFKFCTSWLLEEEFNSRFSAAWKAPASETALYKLQMKINAMRAAGKEWAKLKRNSVVTPTKVVAELQQIALMLQTYPLNEDIQKDFKSIKDELIKVQHCEQLDLQQRAHVSWLTKGDHGSKFFAQAIKSRQAKNSVMGTLDINGIQTNSLAEMKNRALEYFTNLYSTPMSPPPRFQISISELRRVQQLRRTQILGPSPSVKKSGALSKICQELRLRVWMD